MFPGRQIRADPHVMHDDGPLAITALARRTEAVATHTILAPQVGSPPWYIVGQNESADGLRCWRVRSRGIGANSAGAASGGYGHQPDPDQNAFWDVRFHAALLLGAFASDSPLKAHRHLHKEPVPLFAAVGIVEDVTGFEYGVGQDPVVDTEGDLIPVDAEPVRPGLAKLIVA